MGSTRWRKLRQDLWAERGRMLLMVAAVTVSLIAIGTVLGAYAVLTREITASYMGTRPASATLEIPGGVDRTLLGRVRNHPLVAEAEAREVIVARARVGNEWRRMLLFVIDDFESLRLNVFRKESGAWPPADGAMLLERSAVMMVDATAGQSLRVKTPHGAERELAITGLVHDPGLAPAWQERSGYGYITRSTLALLGEAPVLEELRVELKGTPLDTVRIESEARQLASFIADSGWRVREIRVPPPGQHPHQRQMTTILVMMLCFGAMALVLSAILVATSLAAMLARQVREIGVMKTLGARSSQLAGMYAVLVGCVGAAAALLSIPIAAGGTRLLASAISRMLNFNLSESSIPFWVTVVQLLAGVLVPLLIASIPIRHASRVTVREAIDDHGVGPASLRTRLAWLPPAARNPARRPARLALTLALLATGGAMFMMAFNVKEGWQAIVAKVYETRFYDVEIHLQEPQPVSVAERLQGHRSVREMEAWGYAPAAFAEPGSVDVVRSYPDRGHGTLAVMGPPPRTRLVSFPLQSGRWLADDDRDAVVLNHMAMAQKPGLRLGDPVLLSIDGKAHSFRLVGVVEEIGSPAVAYVSRKALADAQRAAEVRMLRIATHAATPHQRTDMIRAIDDELSSNGLAVESVMALAELRTAVGDHILILIRSLVAMAVILGIVGTLGLASAMGVSVVERTRELAVMKVIGATPSRVMRDLVREGLVVGVVSFPVALGISFPLTWLVDSVVGSLGFLAPLPFVFSPFAALGWLVTIVAVSLLATAVPARRAAARGIRDALAQT